jgi:GT2 family glycosyltransferase
MIDEKSGPKPEVSIQITNWNTATLLDQCLNSIIANTRDADYEIIVIDNDSPEAGFQDVKKKYLECENIRWIENKENTGAMVVDQNLHYCHGKYLLIAGPDTVFFPGTVRNMVDFLDSNPQAGAVTAKFLNPDKSTQYYYFRFWDLKMFFFFSSAGSALDMMLFHNRFRRFYSYRDLDMNQTTEIEQPSAVCIMVRLHPPVVDYFSDERFPFYFGDVDLCKRIYDKGYKIFLVPKAEVVHYMSSAFKKANNKWKRREFKKGAIAYFKKHQKSTILVRLIFFLDDIALGVINIMPLKVTNQLRSKYGIDSEHGLAPIPSRRSTATPG